MKVFVLLLAGLATGTAYAAPVCFSDKAAFGKLGIGHCAPVNGGMAKKEPPTCADGSYAPNGGTRFKNGGPKAHAGIDLLAPVGTEIYAAANGIVVDVRNFPKTSGWQVNIRHPDNRVTRYFHLSSAFVRATDQVTIGQPIATSGKTGNARSTSCPHLHLELRLRAYAPSGNETKWSYDDPSDPLSWLAKDAPSFETTP